MFFVYILLSLKDNKKYIGFTKDLDRRLQEHFTGSCKSTKHRRPLKLIYKESFSTKSKAMLREKFLKSGKGREFIKAILIIELHIKIIRRQYGIII